MSGRGEVIFLVFALCARSRGGLDFALGINNIGAVLPELVIFQRPVLKYTWRLSSQRAKLRDIAKAAKELFYSHQSTEFHD
jgi:hypothetical protein